MVDFDLLSPHTVLLMCGYGPVGNPGAQPGPPSRYSAAGSVMPVGRDPRATV
jgi:hypothetical protein